MAVRQLKPIEQRDPHAAKVLAAYDALATNEEIELAIKEIAQRHMPWRQQCVDAIREFRDRFVPVKIKDES